MKHFFIMAASVLTAATLMACSDNSTPAPAGPSITLEGLDITQVHEITGDPMTVKVNVAAEAGIKAFSVKITSPLLTDELLGAIGLATQMELTSPADDDMAAALKDLGFPVGADVTGAAQLSFDISAFIPLIK